MCNQVQVCNEKSTTQISEAQEQKHLEQSVQNVPDLANIKQTSKPLEINNDKTVSLDAHATLLNEAAMDCDIKVGKVNSHFTRKPRQQRQTCLHEFPDTETFPCSTQMHDCDPMHSTDHDHHCNDLDFDASIWEINQQM